MSLISFHSLLDENDEGTVTEHEFAHLLIEKHRRMFQDAPLPVLE